MDHTSLTWSNVAPAVGEIYLGLAICVLLLIEAFGGERRRGFMSTCTLVAIAIGAALQVTFGQVVGRVTLFSGMFVADELALVLKLAGYVVVAVALLYSRAYLEQRK